MNTRYSLFTVATFAAALAVAVPASAQRRRSDDRGSQQSQQSRGQAERRAQPAPQRQEAPRQTQQAPRQTEQRPQATRPTYDAPQRQAQPRQDATRPTYSAPSQTEQRTQAARPSYNAPSQTQQRAIPRTESRTNVYRGDNNYRYQNSRPGSYQAPRSYGYSRPQTFYYGGYSHGYAPVRRPFFTTAYYSFRPRFSIGFGISIGYGVSYPWRYYDPYGRYNYGLGVIPRYDWARTGYGYFYDRVGGISFNIDPYDADVYIDGEYVGVADDFSPGQMPLTLLAGRHRVDLRADGFGPVSFDITVVPGQVIPYAGTLPY